MPSPGARIVYARQYNIRFFGAQKLHPFDSCKYGHTWSELKRQFGSRLSELHVRPSRAVSAAELLQVHSAEYLGKLRSRAYVANALEIPQLRRIPAVLLRHIILRPMQWATMGTMIGAREALRHGQAVNLGGGYHHASRDRGEGFCIYSDIGLAVTGLRNTGDLNAADRVLYIDLDAHQGNGVARVFVDEPRTMIFDMYNKSIYPADPTARRRIDCDLPLPAGCDDSRYLQTLMAELPRFIDGVSRSSAPKLAIYNAGTDIVRNDPLGGLAVSPEGVLARDQFVLEELTRRGIPWLMLLSGGYTRDSFRLVTKSVSFVVEKWGRR